MKKYEIYVAETGRITVMARHLYVSDEGTATFRDEVGNLVYACPPDGWLYVKEILPG